MSEDVTLLAQQPQNMGCIHPRDKVTKSCTRCGQADKSCDDHHVVDLCGLCGRHRCNHWHYS